MMKKWLKKNIEKRLGYQIILKKKTGLLADQEWEEHAKYLIHRIRPYSMVAQEGLLSLYRITRYCEEQQIPGAFVECGVWKGGAVGLMALTNMAFGREPRHLHLFDVFEEICEPDEKVDGKR
ncbi:TylF/MycF/NovP-related O-methyltransferase, partial [Balneolaceae bacterium ANBcel3]|nr:TylF/MycF/NovP-related O-methyltransferase [Balneolaceae bacterium ANBcel3]